MVNGVRYGFLGIAEVDPQLSLAVLSVATVVVTAINIRLFSQGFGLTD